jgi:hypothetical protein
MRKQWQHVLGAASARMFSAYLRSSRKTPGFSSRMPGKRFAVPMQVRAGLKHYTHRRQSDQNRYNRTRGADEVACSFGKPSVGDKGLGPLSVERRGSDSWRRSDLPGFKCRERDRETKLSFRQRLLIWTINASFAENYNLCAAKTLIFSFYV